ncbi:MAG: MBL fold metallo-hydrolase [bacterium]
MAGNDLLVRFWGVRGSYPVPGQNTMRYGGNTSCIEVRAKNHIIILDAGTGIINLGKRLLQELQQKASKGAQQSLAINLLFSHTHYDHVQGFPYFLPAYQLESVLNVYGPKAFSQELAHIISSTMAPQFSPIELDELTAQINIQNINENHLLIFNENSDQPNICTQNQLQQPLRQDVLIRLMRSYAHPKVGVFAFRVEVNDKSVVYATDTEGYVGGDSRMINFAKEAELLIHDAQYEPEEYTDAKFPKQGFGHSTYEMAANVARTANVKHLVLFHHDPAHDDDKIADMEAKTRGLFPNTTAAAEGLEFTF